VERNEVGGRVRGVSRVCLVFDQTDNAHEWQHLFDTISREYSKRITIKAKGSRIRRGWNESRRVDRGDDAQSGVSGGPAGGIVYGEIKTEQKKRAGT